MNNLFLPWWSQIFKSCCNICSWKGTHWACKYQESNL